MSNIIACRINSYAAHEEHAWTHLPQIGIRHVAVRYPGSEGLEQIKRRLAASGLTAVSVHDSCDVDNPDALDIAKPKLAAAAELGAPICFFSVKSQIGPRPEAYDRLRAIGEQAGDLGVTVSVETHPPFAANGDVARETMTAVDHPHVRINFDTANIYYLNEGRDSVTELGKIIEYVASVHLKDSHGVRGQFDFPALGEGVVDFPAIFEMFAQRGFTGPFIMELEGTEGVELDEAAQLKHVETSVEYLRRIGAFG